MMRRRLDLLTMRDVFVAAILLIIFMQIDAQTVSHETYLKSTDGSFSSPNYPWGYPSGIRYKWIMPMSSKKLQIEFIELDLYKCYVKKKNRYCNDYDYVYISKDHKSYCNWNRPTKPITFLPWTRAYISFYSSYHSAGCKGRGFKAKYRPVWDETTTSWQQPTTLSTTTTRFEPTDAKDSGHRSEKFSGTSFLIILLVVPLILVVVCLYWACRRSSRPTVNQNILQTSINNWNYQTGSSVVPHSREHPVRNTHQDRTFLTVDLPPPPRTGYSDGISQTRQPTSPGSYSVQRQTNDNELPETVADDPPPSYDEAWQNNDLNHQHSQSLESPPSYAEAVMRESNQNLESLNQEPLDNHAEPYDNDIQGNVRQMNLESNTSNEANSGLSRFDIII